MIYRVILEVSCYKIAFDFSSMEAAGETAKALFQHLSEDSEYTPEIWIEMIRKEEEEPQDD